MEESAKCRDNESSLEQKRVDSKENKSSLVWKRQMNIETMRAV